MEVRVNQGEQPPEVIHNMGEWRERRGNKMFSLWADADGDPVVAGATGDEEDFYPPVRIWKTGCTQGLRFPLTRLPKGSTVTLTQED